MRYLYTSLASTDGHDGVVGLGAAGRGIHDEPYRLVLFERQARGVEGKHDITLAKDLL